MRATRWSFRGRGALGAATAAALTLGLVTTGVAYADGGTRPSNAPALTPGVTVTGGSDDGRWESPQEVDSPSNQFWRVPLSFGDQLRIDYENVGESETGICLFSPSVTDFTVADSDCLTSDSTDALSQLTYTATRDGGFLVAISNHDYESWGYSMTAYVRHRTVVSLTGPSRAQHGKTITLRGKLSIPGKRKLTFSSKSTKHGWQISSRPTTNAKGAFVARYRLGSAGPHQFKIRFGGTGSYLPSTKTISVQVR